MLCAVFYLLSVLFYHYYVTHTTSIASIAGRKECEKGQAVKSIIIIKMDGDASQCQHC